MTTKSDEIKKYVEEIAELRKALRIAVTKAEKQGITMAHREYRILRHKAEDGTFYAVHEVFYNDRRKPWAWTEAQSPYSEDTAELLRTLKRMLKDAKKNAKKKSIFDYDSKPAGRFDAHRADSEDHGAGEGEQGAESHAAQAR